MKVIEDLKKRIYKPEIAGVLVILLFRFVYYKNVIFAEMDGNSASYIEMDWADFQRGERMPLYPLIIRLNRLLLGEHYLTGVVWCQIIVSLIAVIFFYKAVKMATENRFVACIAMVFYGCYPGIMGFDTFILSESFALSLSVFLLYFAVCYIRDSTWKNGGRMLLLVFLAVCEKSALVIYVPAVFVLLILQNFLLREKRRIVWKLVIVNSLISVFLLIHAGQVYVHAGTFSIDKRGPRHMLAACLQSGIYKNYPDQDLVQKMEKIYTENNQEISWDVLEPIMKMFGSGSKEYNPRLIKFNSYCIRSDPGRFVRYMFGRFIQNAQTTFAVHSMANPKGIIEKVILLIQKSIFLLICIVHIYLIGLSSMLLLIRKWKKSGECPWYYLGTVGILSAIVISVFLGTYGNYFRTMVYVLPFAFFGLALIITDLSDTIQKYKMDAMAPHSGSAE